MRVQGAYSLMYVYILELHLSHIFQDLYCVRSDLGNLLKALGRLDEAKVRDFDTRTLEN